MSQTRPPAASTPAPACRPARGRGLPRPGGPLPVPESDMTDIPDCRLDGLSAADDWAAAARDALEHPGDGFRVLLGHHTGTAAQSFLVIHDTAALWDRPGTPSLIALHITRNLAERTFRIGVADQPMMPFARRWLVNRGCEPDALQVRPGSGYPEPADAATLRIEDRIAASGDRYDVTGHQVELATRAYTVREGAFRDGTTANHWLHFRDAPFPELAPRSADRTRAARRRSAATSPAPPAPKRPPRPDRTTGRHRGGR